MKKVIITLIISSVLFTLVPQRLTAYDQVEHKKNVSFINNENNSEPTIEVKSFENGIFVTKEVGKPRSAIATFVWFLVKAIASGIVYEASVIVWDYVSPHLVAQNWANQNGYGEVSLINNRVVYDNGCWKPEFPNNPFCK